MNFKQTISHLPPIHPEGYIFVVIGAATSFLIGSFSTSIGWICALTTIFIACFFRDPKRVTPEKENLVISPADGLVERIEDATAPEELKLGNKTFKRISIFLSVFNVHVNRVPVSGTVTNLHYRNGKFLNASLDKASTDNERQTCVVQTKKGTEVIFVQIAGLIARRIVCDLNVKQEVKAGERFGIIRFGSRVDIYLPKDTEINIIEGQTTIGGETVLATLKEASAEKKPAEKKKKAAPKKK